MCLIDKSAMIRSENQKGTRRIREHNYVGHMMTQQQNELAMTPQYKRDQLWSLTALSTTEQQDPTGVCWSGNMPL
jgi:hypothetical protein